MSERLIILGRGMWKGIHRLSYLVYKGVLSRERFNDMMEMIIDIIPCERCADKSRKYHKMTLNEEDVFIMWWYHHQNVNESNGKSGINEKQALSNARNRASEEEIPGLEYILFNTTNAQLHRIIHKLLK